jgi:dipeptidase E
MAFRFISGTAASMVTAPMFGETYDDHDTPCVIDEGLGLVDFALLPHLDHEDHPESSMAKVERMAAEVPLPAYGTDDESAISVTHGDVEVASGGHWKLFGPEQSSRASAPTATPPSL